MLEVEEIIKLNKDWISIFFLLSLLILGFLNKIDKKKFGLLVYSFNSEKYFSVYAKEKKINYFDLFNVSKIIFTTIIKSILLTFIIDELISFETFKTIFLIILIIIVPRYFFLKYVFKFLNLQNLFDQLIFKSISTYFRMSLFTFPLLLIYRYTLPTSIIFLYLVSFLIAFVIFFMHLIIYYKIAHDKTSSFFYIILYLCAFKVTPWLLVYSYITS
ncbi:MAG: hypothetical protein CMC91_07680 [Flavobacteriaceae bacterium]|nr:hypothetical protein [Flavobacteriaceae bacterium]|tara:strand:+ start:4146 stop:4793 length:648 start_codon:yes stop_codon:yes gene_type:complete